MAEAGVSARDLGMTLKAAVQRYFPTYGALETFLRGNLGLWLNNITDRSVGLDDVSWALVKWAQTRGEDRQLLARLAISHPDDAVLGPLVAQLGLDLAAFPPKLAAFGGLERAAADPETRAAFEPYRLDIERLCHLSIEVRDWKFLHDGVDQIRTGTFLKLLAHNDSNPLSATTVKIIAHQHGLLVETLVARAETMTKEGTMVIRDRDWLDMCLLPATQLLATLGNTWPDKGNYDTIMQLLTVVTTSGLLTLNRMITTKAGSITELHILDKLALLKSRTAGEGETEIARDIAAVETAVTSVIAGNEAHDVWQTIKDRLEQLQKERLEPGNVMATVSWSMVRPLLDQVIPQPPQVGFVSKMIDEAFASPDWAGLKDAVEELRSIVMLNFFQADKDLLRAADSLVEIGSALQKVLEKLDG